MNHVGRCGVLGCDEEAGAAISVLPEGHGYLDINGNPVVMKMPICVRHHHAVTVEGVPWRHDSRLGGGDGTVIVLDTPHREESDHG